MILRPSDARLIENVKKLKPPITWSELHALAHEAMVVENRAKLAFADALRFTLSDEESRREIRKARIRFSEARAHTEAVQNLMTQRRLADERASDRGRKKTRRRSRGAKAKYGNGTVPLET